MEDYIVPDVISYLGNFGKMYEAAIYYEFIDGTNRAYLMLYSTRPDVDTNRVRYSFADILFAETIDVSFDEEREIAFNMSIDELMVSEIKRASGSDIFFHFSPQFGKKLIMYGAEKNNAKLHTFKVGRVLKPCFNFGGRGCRPAFGQLRYNPAQCLEH